MASSTRQAMSAGNQALDAVLKSADLNFAEQLLAIGAAVGSSVQLRNILSDPSGEAATKQKALAAVFGKSVSKEALSFAGVLSGLRWSKGSDLVHAFEAFGVYTVASIAASSKKLESLEQEVFSLRSLIDSDHELMQALSSRQASTDAKVELVASLTKGKVSAEASLLARYSVIGSKNRKVSIVLDHFGKLISEVAERLVAVVTVAQPLSAEQTKRLEAVLAAGYGKSLNLNVVLDPTIIGGVRVQVAGEIIDGSIASRLNQAKLQLA